MEITKNHSTQSVAARPIKHLQYIDALRGIAVAIVIAVHVAGMVHLEGPLEALLSRGAKGVQLFYIVSALTLMMSMKKRMRVEANPLRNFFLRRVFRIAPAFYAILLVYCILGWKVDNHVSGVTYPSPNHVLLVMSFFNGWRPDTINSPVAGQWSIAVEMMFYLLLPCIFPLLTSFRRAVSMWWISILLYSFSYPLASYLARWEGFLGPVNLIHNFSYFWFPTQLPIFLLGTGAYFIIREGIPLQKYILPYLPAVPLLLFAHYKSSEVGMLPLVGIALLIAVVFLSKHPTTFLVNRFSILLGKISFSAYLCHPLVLTLIHAYIPADFIRNTSLRFCALYLFALFLIIPLGLLMWTWIEEPFQRLGRSIIVRLSPVQQ